MQGKAHLVYISDIAIDRIRRIEYLEVPTRVATLHGFARYSTYETDDDFLAS